MVEPFVKFVPLAWSVTLGAPTVALDGTIDDSVGLGGGGGALPSEFVLPPPQPEKSDTQNMNASPTLNLSRLAIYLPYRAYNARLLGVTIP